ncbi:hypothetical protein ZWY2020_047503 [Hordeum vulgare]|nr:hypothetical protein ZWY2020_047503 [Hordeum vulgare]
MGSDSDDADFFDKLVDDDDDDASRPPPAAKSHAAAEDAADLAALTLDDADDGTGGAPEPEPQPAAASPEPQAEAEPPVAPPQADALTATPDAEVLPSLPEVEAAAPDAEVPAALPEVKEEAPNDEVPAGLPEVKAVAAPDPEGRSPGSGSGSGSSKGVRTTVKQVQWSLFGADISSGTEPDPFSDLLADSAGDPFLGAAVGAQVSGFGATTVGAVDHSFYNGVASSNASSQLGWGAGSGEFLADGRVGEDTFFGVQGSAVGTAGSVAADDHSFFNGVDGNASSHSYMGAGVVESADLQNTVAQSDWTGGAVDPSDPYPGWKWDVATGQWYQVDTIGAQGFADNNAGAAAAVGGENVQQQQHLGVSYLQNSSQAGLETITEEASAAAATWGQDQSSAAAAEYPPNMLFYAEYPEHYYDSNTQQWFTLESYQQSVVQAATPASALDAFAGEGHGVVHTGNTQASSFNQQNQWQHVHQGFKPFTNNQRSTGFVPSSSHQIAHKEFEPPKDNQAHHVAHQSSSGHGYDYPNGFVEPQKSVPVANMYQMQTQTDAGAHMHLPNNYVSTENSMSFPQQLAPSQQLGYSHHEERSSAGRPPHSLVAFGFGGKLVVMKETSSMTTNFDSGNQGNSQGTVSILNISEVVADKINQQGIPSSSALSYFYALCRRPIPGPLAGGSAAAKDLNKWLDDIIGGYESSVSDFQGGDVQKLLISLLKISYQHYGKLRSPFGPDPSREGMDGPDTAVTALFSSCNSNSARMRDHCMKNIPSENQIQATAQEVQNLLVSGRRKEALQYAQEGQLWGPALILALQLGDQFYADTVKKMAYCHFKSGSPLRTLCLLIAGQPADVFNAENSVDANYGTLHRQQQPAEGTPVGMLNDWQQNLAIITANRTKGDELVITHLGDCLWKERNEVAAAHSCYLVAELNIDPYSESARMCLLGADHLRCPRTFTSPEAIQRTEMYEYAKVLGNSQYILLPFQPYKLIYAYMLAEVGKVSDSLKYCQASLKLLKSSGRAPELEAWKQLFSSLEERIRTHQQGGYGTNLAPAKLVGKIFSTFDKSLSRMMGTQPAPVPPLSQGSSGDRDFYPVPQVTNSAPQVTNFVNSQSPMPMSSSTSEQFMSEMAENSGPDKKGAHNRSVSEPDFIRKQGGGSDSAQSTSGSGSSRFGWLLQKTVGLVSKSSNQAKLGEENNFYFDDNLKRWVERGAAVPAAAEPPLAPPPTKASFQNGVPDHNNSTGPPSGGGYTPNGFSEMKPPNPSEPLAGMPPMPPSQNQFSSRGRVGVRSRYVDTFNKGGGSANAFGAPSYSKPAMPSVNKLPSASFFVPTPAVDASMQPTEPTADAHNETANQDVPSSSPAVESSFYASPPPPMQMQPGMQRHPSMDNIMTPSGSGNGTFSKSRAASWSGTYSEQMSSTAASRSSDGQTMQSPPMMPGMGPSHSRSHSNSSLNRFNSGGFGEDLQEVEL